MRASGRRVHAIIVFMVLAILVAAGDTSAEARTRVEGGRDAEADRRRAGPRSVRCVPAEPRGEARRSRRGYEGRRVPRDGVRLPGHTEQRAVRPRGDEQILPNGRCRVHRTRRLPARGRSTDVCRLDQDARAVHRRRGHRALRPRARRRNLHARHDDARMRRTAGTGAPVVHRTARDRRLMLGTEEERRSGGAIHGRAPQAP